MRLLVKLVCAASFFAATAQAFEMPEDEAEAQFVESNVLATFYHELGHALIDQLELPVLGREEDAADTLSALLIHDIWEEDSATAMIYDTAYSFRMYSDLAEANGDELAFADVHSLDLQRYYNLICLFYGANPDVREDVAVELELPEDRAATCPDEFEQADASWGGLLEGLDPGPKSKGLRMITKDRNDPIVALLTTEIADMNKIYGLPEWVDVQVASCGEANAFYNPDDGTITICTEYADEMVALWESQ